MIPWEYSHPQAGSCATWTEEPLPKPPAGSEAKLPAQVWRRRAVHPAAVTTWSWGLDDGFPQVARASGALETDFPQVRTGAWGLDDGFSQTARASGALEMPFPQVTTGSWALEIEFPGGTTSSAGLKNAFLGAAACPDRPQGRFFSSLDEPQLLTR